jgi:hypothetical protein
MTPDTLSEVEHLIRQLQDQHERIESQERQIQSYELVIGEQEDELNTVICYEASSTIKFPSSWKDKLDYIKIEVVDRRSEFAQRQCQISFDLSTIKAQLQWLNKIKGNGVTQNEQNELVAEVISSAHRIYNSTLSGYSKRDEFSGKLQAELYTLGRAIGSFHLRILVFLMGSLINNSIELRKQVEALERTAINLDKVLEKISPTGWLAEESNNGKLKDIRNTLGTVTGTLNEQLNKLDMEMHQAVPDDEDREKLDSWIKALGNERDQANTKFTKAQDDFFYIERKLQTAYALPVAGQIQGHLDYLQALENEIDESSAALQSYKESVRTFKDNLYKS